MLLAQKGLAELATFDRARMSDTERVSAELMQWQLSTLVEGEKYRDYTFPIDQFGGVNVNLPNILTVTHPLATEKDAVHYVARLGQVATRMDEAIAEAKRPDREEHVSAAVHPARHHRADAAVHRDAAGEKPLRDGVRRPDGGGEIRSRRQA